MTIMDFVWAFIGFLICIVILTVVILGIMLVLWWIFKTGQDMEIEYKDWEEENNG